MNGFLLDTNCISELVKSTPKPSVVSWVESADEDLLYLSVLTMAEIRKGLMGLPQGKRRSHLESWLGELHSRFAGRVLSVDADVADRWGILAAEAKMKGRVLSTTDALLAATALHHNLTIVSRNDSDFAHTHVQLLNPWKM
jgi:toxin FitB